MKSTGIVRNIDELGRLVIPKEMRTTLGINCNDALEFFVDGDKIIIKKVADSCVFCASQTDLLTFKNKLICKSCLEEIKN